MSTIKTSGTAKADLIDRRKDTANNQYISGAAGNDTLYGSVLDDTLDGGAGSDLMVGGAGNDLYFVNSTGDSVVEDATGGIDTISTTLSLDLTASASRFQNVENLMVNASVLTSTAMVLGGNAAANVLTGHAGADTLKGYAGNDTLQGLAGNDVLDGGDGDDALDGGLGNDKLSGGNGNDWLQGSAGADTMDGGAGDDNFVVDSASDVVVESANGGIDTINTTLTTYSLAKLTNVENLRFAGTGNANLTGNALANTLAGGVGNDYLSGGAGNDTLSGGAGTDTLDGGAGNDSYFVDSATTRIVEAAGGGRDVVNATVSFDLSQQAAQVEVLNLMGKNLVGVGNALDNFMVAAEGATLRGGAGNDTLVGATGDDVLIGDDGDDLLQDLMGGRDSFVFDGSFGADVVRLHQLGGNVAEGTLDFTQLSPNQLWLHRDANGQLIVQQLGTGNQVTVEGFSDPIDFTGTVTWHVNAGTTSLTGDALTRLIDYMDGLGSVPTSVSNLSAQVQADLATLWRGEALTNTVGGTAGGDSLQGTAGNDLILGGDGNDYIVLTTGNDTLRGEVGNDSYQLKGTITGARTVIDDQGAAGETNALLIVDGSQKNDLWFTRSGNDLRIDIESRDEVITLQGWFSNPTALAVRYGNADGTLTTLDTKSLAGLATLVSDTSMFGDARNLSEVNPDLLDLATAAFDAMWSRSATPPPPPAPAYNTVTGTAGNDNLTGGSGNDAVSALEGNDTLRLTAGEDTLNGGAGNDTYVLKDAVQGARTIIVEPLTTGETNTLFITDGSSHNDLWFTQSGKDLVIDELARDETITVKGWFSNASGLTIVHGNADGTGQVMLRTTDLVNLARLNTSLGPARNLSEVDPGYIDLATTAQDALWAKAIALGQTTPPAGYNTIEGTSKDDKLVGQASDDLILGLEGNDTLQITSGQDTLVGGWGSDVYLTTSQSAGARTTISDQGTSSDVNTVLLADGTLSSDLWFSRGTGTNDLRIDNVKSDETITVKDWFSNPTGTNVVYAAFDQSNPITLKTDTLRSFANLASVYDGARSLNDVPAADRDLMSAALQSLWATSTPVVTPPTPEPGVRLVADPAGTDLLGGAGNDTLIGQAGDDNLDGGDGDDILVGGEGLNFIMGGAGNDAYLLSGQSAINVVIDGGGSADVVRVTDVNANDLWFSLSGTSRQTLTISQIGGSMVAQVHNWSSSQGAIEEIQAQSPNGVVSLSSAQLGALINAMAGFSTPLSVTDVPTTVAAAQQNAWHVAANPVTIPA